MCTMHDALCIMHHGKSCIMHHCRLHRCTYTIPCYKAGSIPAMWTEAELAKILTEKSDTGWSFSECEVRLVSCEAVGSSGAPDFSHLHAVELKPIDLAEEMQRIKDARAATSVLNLLAKAQKKAPLTIE